MHAEIEKTHVDQSQATWVCRVHVTTSSCSEFLIPNVSGAAQLLVTCCYSYSWDKNSSFEPGSIAVRQQLYASS
jgi:hypothetical protein